MTGSVHAIGAISRAARRRLGPIIANRWVGRLASIALNNRIPHRGLMIDTRNSLVSDKLKAALLFGGYESAEQRFVGRYLPTDCDVIELGGSIGVMSCIIRRRMGRSRRLIVLEAIPSLARSIETNLKINGCKENVEIVGGALSYDQSSEVSFEVGDSSVAGRVGHGGGNTISVPAVTLQGLIDRHGISDYALVVDIEGVEWSIVDRDLDALAQARVVIMETHDSPGGEGYMVLIDRIVSSGRFTLVDRYGPVVVLTPVAA